ncbi:MAG: AEC family transporter [Thermodesulfobacteriota bacterium]
MVYILINIFPVIMTFFTGVLLKKLKIVSGKDADAVLKIIFYAGIPALILTNLPGISVDGILVFLPVFAILTLISSGLLSFAFSIIFKTEQKRSATGAVGAMMMNIGFCLPFVIAFYGKEGLAKALIFDAGNAFFVFTVTYFVANFFGTNKTRQIILFDFLKTPPLIAIIFAIFLNIYNINLPEPIFKFFEFLSDMVFPMIMLSIGIKFSPGSNFSFYMLFSVLSRMAGGFLAAYFMLSFIDVDIVTRQAVLMCSAAPVGFNTITFSVIKGLDDEFAASLVSYSAGAGLIVLPLIYYFTG